MRDNRHTKVKSTRLKVTTATKGAKQDMHERKRLLRIIDAEKTRDNDNTRETNANHTQLQQITPETRIRANDETGRVLRRNSDTTRKANSRPQQSETHTITTNNSTQKAYFLW